MTRYKVFRFNLNQSRLLMRAVVHHFGAAGGKAAAGWRVNKVGRATGNARALRSVADARQRLGLA